MSDEAGGEVVLASASAVRARLLVAAGLVILRDPAALDEGAIKAEFRGAKRAAGDCALALAEAKARLVCGRHTGAWVIGADQILDCEGRWFDKPRDLAEARAQLQTLAGKRHDLVSAIVVLRDGAMIWQFVDRAQLTLRRFSAAFLDAYLTAVGEAALDSVGAYQLEGRGAQLMARVEGDYFSILGLPLLPLLDFLRGQGVIAT